MKLKKYNYQAFRYHAPLLVVTLALYFPYMYYLILWWTWDQKDTKDIFKKSFYFIFLLSNIY